MNESQTRSSITLRPYKREKIHVTNLASGPLTSTLWSGGHYPKCSLLCCFPSCSVGEKTLFLVIPSLESDRESWFPSAGVVLVCRTWHRARLEGLPPAKQTARVNTSARSARNDLSLTLDSCARLNARAQEAGRTHDAHVCFSDSST